MAAHASHHRERSRRSSFAVGCGTVFVLGAGWILLVAGTRLHEMIVGAMTVAASTVFVLKAQRSDPVTFDYRWRDVFQVWRVPWYIVSGIWEITVILLKDILFIRRAGSFYRVCGFKSGKYDSRIVAREALATIYTTMAPNFIVIGIDPELSRMLFHQIERSGVPKMTRSLGALP